MTIKAKRIGELRKKGLAAEAINRYLAQIGTRSFKENEGWGMKSLSKNFQIERYRSGDAVFSLTELLSMNSYWIANTELNTLIERFTEWLGLYHPSFQYTKIPNIDYLIDISKHGVNTFSDLLDTINSIIKNECEDLNTIVNYEPQELFEHLLAQFANISEENWTESNLNEIIRQTGKSLNIKGKNLFMPIRLALTGRTHGPELPKILMYLGSEIAIERLRRCLK